jgi:hypothetical protein
MALGLLPPRRVIRYSERGTAQRPATGLVTSTYDRQTMRYAYNERWRK